MIRYKDDPICSPLVSEIKKSSKGKRARKAVDSKFNDSEISDLVISEFGSKSAKDRLKELERIKK